MSKIILIIGGAKSGKTSYAIEKAKSISQKVAYIATAPSNDNSMRERIEIHRKERPKEWHTYEEEIEVSKLLKKIESNYDVIIIDCLTLYISNFLLYKTDEYIIYDKIDQLIAVINRKLYTSIIITNEVGLGVHPDNQLALKFIDISGKINQKFSKQADEVYFTVLGIPLKIK